MVNARSFRTFNYILPIATPVCVSARGHVAESPGPLPALDNDPTGARARGAGHEGWADELGLRGVLVLIQG